MFRASNTLKQHMGVHEDLKPFRCSRCGRGFRQKQHLAAHGRKQNKCRIEIAKISPLEKDVLVPEPSNYNLSGEDFSAKPLGDENAGTDSSRYCDLEDTSNIKASCHQKEVEPGGTPFPAGEMTPAPGRTGESPTGPGPSGQPRPVPTSPTPSPTSLFLVSGVPPTSKRQGGKRKETCAVCGPTHQTRHRIPPTSEPDRRAQWIRCVLSW